MATTEGPLESDLFDASAREYARKARTALEVGDYSHAATQCHRAYQKKLVAEALRARGL